MSWQGKIQLTRFKNKMCNASYITSFITTQGLSLLSCCNVRTYFIFLYFSKRLPLRLTLKLSLLPFPQGIHLKTRPGNQLQVTKPIYKGGSGQVETSISGRGGWCLHIVSLDTKEYAPLLCPLGTVLAPILIKV